MSDNEEDKVHFELTEQLMKKITGKKRLEDKKLTKLNFNQDV
jgi:hypothetical protein